MAQYNVSGGNEGYWLRMDGTGVTSFAADGGGSAFGVPPGTPPGPWGLFEIVQHADGTVNIASVAFPGVFLRMDGRGVNSFTWNGGGTVNCQFGAGPWETFTLKTAGVNNPAEVIFNVNIESVAFPNVYLRMAGDLGINCQYTPGPWELISLDLLANTIPGTVPDVINQSPEHAIAIIQAAGFLYASTANGVEGDFNPFVESQTPEAGIPYPVGGIISVTIAEPTEGTVPDVINERPNNARARILAAGFSYSGTADPIEGNFKPYVEDQNPEGGTTAPLGSTVTVTIATPVKGLPR